MTGRGVRGRVARCAPLALMPLLLVTTSCEPALVVRVSTRVFDDGSLERRLEVVGRDAEGEAPTDPAWLAQAVGVRLAQPAAWARVEERPGQVVAEGIFRHAADLPALLAFDGPGGSRAGREATTLEVDSREVIERWIYTERYGDLYGPDESRQSLEALIDLLVETLDRELERHYGDEVPREAARSVLRDEAVELASEILTALRRHPRIQDTSERSRSWSAILADHGVAVVPTDDDVLDFWEHQIPALLDWARALTAEALSTPARPVQPEELSFWPAGEDYEGEMSALASRSWGSEERLSELAEPHLRVLGGYFAGESSARFRFEVAVELPGQLVATNGTPRDEGAFWLFREADLTTGDRVLLAHSIVLRQDALRRLGARRELDLLRQAQLADLLWNRDPRGELRELLRRALEASDVGLLCAAGDYPEMAEAEARELGELLDPGGCER